MKPLTAAAQHHIITQYGRWENDGRVRIQALHKTTPLLRMAGHLHPRPFAFYHIRARLLPENGGTYLLDRSHRSLTA